MSNAVLKGNASGTGTVTLESPNTNSDRTIALPDSDGTVMVSGNMPAFSAYQSAAQTLSNASYTKIQFQSKEFDTASAFDNVTNYRFQPTVAGYYQLNLSFVPSSSSRGGECQVLIYKNGAPYKTGTDLYMTATYILSMSCLVYLNGSTDYVEGYIYAATGGTNSPSQSGTYFQGALVRAA